MGEKVREITSVSKDKGRKIMSIEKYTWSTPWRKFCIGLLLEICMCLRYRFKPLNTLFHKIQHAPHFSHTKNFSLNSHFQETCLPVFRLGWTWYKTKSTSLSRPILSLHLILSPHSPTEKQGKTNTSHSDSKWKLVFINKDHPRSPINKAFPGMVTLLAPGTITITMKLNGGCFLKGS